MKLTFWQKQLLVVGQVSQINPETKTKSVKDKSKIYKTQNSKNVKTKVQNHVDLLFGLKEVIHYETVPLKQVYKLFRFQENKYHDCNIYCTHLIPLHQKLNISFKGSHFEENMSNLMTELTLKVRIQVQYFESAYTH